MLSDWRAVKGVFVLGFCAGLLYCTLSIWIWDLESQLKHNGLVCFLLLLSYAKLAAGCDSGVDPDIDRPFGSVIQVDPQEKKVTIEIDFGELAEKKTLTIPWKVGLNVLDAMNQAKQEKRLKFKYRGKGVSAFLTQIEGVKNQGAKGDNWIFRVNSKLANRSFGVILLKAGDQVNWSLGKYKPGKK